jgi:predicted AAA+ superfamily ATPase
MEFYIWKLPEVIDRDITLPSDSNKIISVVGPRRTGKTYLLFQHIHRLLKNGLPKEKCFYLNFEDERLDLTNNELDLILQVYRELYPDIDLSECYFFFDEVQNVDGWERFVRRIYDSISKNVFITGSNSKLLGEEIATSLRGRTIKYKVLPLSFKEFLRFKRFVFNSKRDLYDSGKKSRLINMFSEYFIYGGFPEIVFLSEDLKIKTIQEYFEVMIYRDIAERYGIKDTLVLKYFLKRLVENTTKNLSVYKIYNELKSQGMKVGKDTLYKYLDYVQNVYMIKLLKKHHHSIIKTEFAEKKVYLIDNGFLKSIRAMGREDFGILLENMVFHELSCKYDNIVYFKGRKECDFVLDDNIVLQVCYDLSNPETAKREIEGLKEACKYFGKNKGYIITYDEKYHINENGIDIFVLPAYDLAVTGSLE